MGDGHVRLALLQRLATDMHVVASSEPVARPDAMPCCWTYYDKPTHLSPGDTLTTALLMCGVECRHVHHRHEVIQHAVVLPADL